MKLLEESRSIQESNVLVEKVPSSSRTIPERMIFHDPSWRRKQWLRGMGKALGVCAVILGTLFIASLMSKPMVPSVPGRALAPKADGHDIGASSNDAEERAVGSGQNDAASLNEEGARPFQAGTFLAPVQAQHIVAAFYAPWQETGLHSLRAHADALTHVMPEWLHLDPSGTGLSLYDWDPKTVPPNLSVVQLARAHRVRITPILNNAEGEKFDSKRVHLLLGEVRRQRQLAIQLRDWLVENGFQGVNVDFENLYPQDYARLPSFLTLLRSVLQPAGMEVSIDIEAENKHLNWPATAAACDFVILMAYDEHDSGAAPGPIASHPWYQRVLDRALRKIPANKLVAGVGNYAYDWTAGKPPAQSLTYQQALFAARKNRPGDEPGQIVIFDPRSRNPTFHYVDEAGHSHEAWMLDAVTAANQLRLARQKEVRGAALWLLGSEDPSIWELLHRDRFDRPMATETLRDIKFPYHIDFVGEGEILRVAALPQSGVRRLTIEPETSLCVDAKYERFPSAYVIERAGLQPKTVALTFDDGPAIPHTPKVLDELKRLGVRATFFVVGKNAVNHPDLIERLWLEGHEIGNHTFSHAFLQSLSTPRAHLELNLTQRALQSVLGRSTLLFRPPYRADAEPTAATEILPIVIASRLGYLTVGEFIDPRDWNLHAPIPGGGVRELHAQDLAQEVIREVKAGRGNVVLLHDGGGDRSQTVAALALIVPALQQEGYRFATLSELVGTTRDGIMPPVSAKEMAFVGADRIVFGASYRAGQFLSVAFVWAIALGLGRLLFVLVSLWAARRRERRRVFDESHRPGVSVLIAAYNEQKVIGKTVAAVLETTYRSLEVIVVDDGSSDGTADTLEQVFGDSPQVRVLRRRHRGKGAALNHAIHQARGEILLCLDADTLIARDAIHTLVRHFADASVGAVAGNIKVGNRTGILTRWQAIEYITSQNLDRRAYALFNAVTVVPGAIGAWRKEALLQVGGYREDTLAEDTDLTWRVRTAGWRVEADNEALGFTEAPETLSGLFRQRFRWTFGTLQCLWKHRDALGRYGWFGCVLLPSLWLFQIVFQALAPLVDLQVFWALADAGLSWLSPLRVPQDSHPLQETNPLYTMGLMYGLFFLVELGCSLVAFRFDRERMRLLWSLFWQRFAYRQLMYLVLLKSVLTALQGMPARWMKVERMGTAKLATG